MFHEHFFREQVLDVVSFGCDGSRRLLLQIIITDCTSHVAAAHASIRPPHFREVVRSMHCSRYTTFCLVIWSLAVIVVRTIVE